MTEQQQTLMTLQEQLEDGGVRDGVRRFQEAQRKAMETGTASQLASVRGLQGVAAEGTARSIQAQLDEWDAKKQRRRHDAFKLVQALGVDVCAVHTAMAVLDTLPNDAAATDVARAIYDRLYHEVVWTRMREQANPLYIMKLEALRVSSSQRHRKASMKAAALYAGIDLSDVTSSQRLLIGNWFLHHFITGTSFLDLQGPSGDTLGTGLYIVVSDRLTTRKAGRTQHRGELTVQPTEALLRWVDMKTEQLTDAHPVRMPLVVPPKRWGPRQQGGYHFKLAGRYTLVRRVRKDHARKISERVLPAVYTTLNALQETPWRINTEVLDLIHEIERRGGDMAKVAATETVPVPAQVGGPFDADTTEGAQKLRAWKRAVTDSHRAEALRIRERLGQVRTLVVADRMREHAAIYFAHNLDFRGRVYPICDYLTPQGDQLQKALLTFATGKPVGVKGGEWLAIHLANCVDVLPDGRKVSTLTLAQRVEWVREHTDMIVAAAESPFEARWWAEAGEPLMCWAACREWARYAAAGFSPEYVSSFPVAMDGSCNGLQHYAAMLRDETGGAAVNLVPLGVPQDVYRQVAGAVQAAAERDAGDGSVQARLWLESGLINRTLAKMPTMTFGYGSSRFGFEAQLQKFFRTHDNARQLRQHFTREVPTEMATVPLDMCRYFITQLRRHGMEDVLVGLNASAPHDFRAMIWVKDATLLREALRVVQFSEKPDNVTGGVLLKGLSKLPEWATLEQTLYGRGTALLRVTTASACAYMAVLFEEALAQIVVGAVGARQWLREVAAAVAKGGKPLSWTVPATGFPVRQEYWASQRKRVRTELAGQVIMPCVYEATNTVERHKQINGAAPNFVHSLDAAALMLTVEQANAEGVECFGMVHDSYATVPGDAALLARTTREAFVSLYAKHDPLASLYEEARLQVEEPESIPALDVTKGALDLGGVLVSEYFFC
jgi:DNA-directed RNA polymerase, mitochondrial